MIHSSTRVLRGQPRRRYWFWVLLCAVLFGFFLVWSKRLRLNFFCVWNRFCLKPSGSPGTWSGRPSWRLLKVIFLVSDESRFYLMSNRIFLASAAIKKTSIKLTIILTNIKIRLLSTHSSNSRQFFVLFEQILWPDRRVICLFFNFIYRFMNLNVFNRMNIVRTFG